MFSPLRGFNVGDELVTATHLPALEVWTLLPRLCTFVCAPYTYMVGTQTGLVPPRRCLHWEGFRKNKPTSFGVRTTQRVNSDGNTTPTPFDDWPGGFSIFCPPPPINNNKQQGRLRFGFSCARMREDLHHLMKTLSCQREEERRTERANGRGTAPALSFAPHSFVIFTFILTSHTLATKRYFGPFDFFLNLNETKNEVPSSSFVECLITSSKPHDHPQIHCGNVSHALAIEITIVKQNKTPPFSLTFALITRNEGFLQDVRPCVAEDGRQDLYGCMYGLAKKNKKNTSDAIAFSIDALYYADVVESLG